MDLYKNENPKISVIMSTYNRAKFLKRSIDSMFTQTFIDWELIIVDDGGTDDTFDIINEYLMKYDHVRYLKHKNRRPALAINSGIQAAAGEYVTILCSDDEYLPDHLQLRYEYMQSNSNIDFIHGGVEIIGDPYVKDKDDKNKKIHLEQCAIGGTFFCRRDIFIGIGGFQKVGYGGDANLLTRISNKYKVAKVNFSTYRYYRDTPDSITNNIK